MAGSETLPLELEVNSTLLDSIEESLDVSLSGESELRALPIGQSMLSACKINLRLQSLFQMLPALALGSLIAKQPVVEILSLNHHAIEIETYRGFRG